MFKRLKYAVMLNVLPPLAYLFLSVLKSTWRIQHANREPVDRLWRQGQNIIACFWHGRLLAMPFAYKGEKRKVLISRHRDGEFITRIVAYFGLGTVRGSHRKGSVSSIREMLAELKDGTNLGITPDGPKGPRYRMKPGIIELARLTGRPIVPVTYSASKKKEFHSWDRFILPYPFSRILFLWGEPVWIARDTDSSAIEAKRVEIEQLLVTMTEKADQVVCGN